MEVEGKAHGLSSSQSTPHRPERLRSDCPAQFTQPEPPEDKTLSTQIRLKLTITNWTSAPEPQTPGAPDGSRSPAAFCCLCCVLLTPPQT
ncbi:hypothetical protein INR49_006869 [Caranx melampygus]|nr:hypothetical protein INR49_006869 [Caranx melampygus]